MLVTLSMETQYNSFVSIKDVNRWEEMISNSKYNFNDK